MKSKFYTGVGSRTTPKHILILMTVLARALAERGFVLRSGGAQGADKAFQDGAGAKEIYRPEQCTDDAKRIAAKFHPAWNAMSDYAQRLHGRNAFQVLGLDLNTPSEFLICWTPDGCTSHKTRSIKTGGTGTAISIAEANGVRIWNLAVPETLEMTKRFITGGTR